MPKKNSSSDDLDSFLDDFEDSNAEPAESVEDLVPVEEFQTSFEEDYEEASEESEEDAEIARLKAELAAPVEVKAKILRPKPEHKLTEKEKEIRHLQDEIARKKAEAIENADAVYDEEDGDTFLINFVSDGFTAFGQVWYTGQELEFHVGGSDYALTQNGDGKSWLNLSEDEQIERYGRVMFRRGPWKGKRLAADEMSAAERRRARRVPMNF